MSLRKEYCVVFIELNEGNRQREIKGLFEAMEYCKLKKGLILTFDQQEEITIQHKKIQVIPAWKWMFSNKGV